MGGWGGEARLWGAGAAGHMPNNSELSKELKQHEASMSIFFLFLPKRVKHMLQVGHFLPSLSK